jgi:hypothetical protein
MFQGTKYPSSGETIVSIRYLVLVTLYAYQTFIHREWKVPSVKRDKINKMQQSYVSYQLLSQHVLGIIMPIFRRTKTVWCYCTWCTALALLDVGSRCGALRCRMQALWRLLSDSNLHSACILQCTTHNRYQPHPAEPVLYTICSNTTRSLTSWRWA